MKSLDMMYHVVQNSACGRNKIQYRIKSEGYPGRTVIAHNKVTARACPQPRKMNPRQHLLLVSGDLRADMPWGDFYFLSKVIPDKKYPLTNGRFNQILSPQPFS